MRRCTPKAPRLGGEAAGSALAGCGSMAIPFPTAMLKPEDYRPTAPVKKDYGIGIVGCGGVARGAHLPAYRQFGYRVIGCCDVDPEAARRAREEFDIPFGTTRIEELASRDDVEILDLAVPAAVRREVMEQAS